MSRNTNPTTSGNPPQSGEDLQQIQEQILKQQPHFRRLTAEEMKAIRECNRESFFYRAVPLSLAGAMGVRYLGSIGYLKPSPTTGYFWKYTAAVVLGYFVGKFSYMGKCREKLMRIPNSELGEALRKSYGGGKRHFEILQEMVTLPEIGTSGGGDQGYAPMREGSDMYTNPDFRVSSGSRGTESAAADQPAQKPSTTYDELRRRNREEYLRQQFGGGTGSPVQGQQPPGQQQQPLTYDEQQRKSRFGYGPQQSEQPSSKDKSGSKYGDTDFK